MTCAECHAAEYEAWQASTHAQASNIASFQEAWVRSGRRSECLSCHTTGYDAITEQAGAAGVTCQACHATEGGEHPREATMSVRISSEACGECHENTFKEWQLSGHGRRGVECVACHQSHSQGLRVQPTEALCGRCHGSRLEDQAHSSHARKDLACADCHMPENPAAKGIGAVNTVGHTFNVGAQTCSQCHQDQIHGHGAEMVNEQTARLLTRLGSDPESQAVQAARERVRILTSESETLKRELERQHVLTYVGGAFGFGIGILVGLTGALVLIFVLQRRSTL